MRLHRLLAAALLAFPMPLAHAQNPPSPTTLSALRDRFRVLLVFAKSPDDPALLAQAHMLKDDAPGMHDRDLLLIAVPYNTPSPSEVTLTPDATQDARHRFHVAPSDFTVLLLGKDGGEKFRANKPVPFSRLRDKIDTMPMRQEEMRDPGQH